MFVPETKIVYNFKYTRKVFFNDGRMPLVEELTIESEVSLPQFKKNVEEWHRRGQVMKEIPSKSHIQGYDYWMTQEQEDFNKTVTYIRKEELKYVFD